MNRFKLIFHIASRLLAPRADRGLLGLIGSVSVAGVFIGVLALAVVTSVINGFQDELERTIAGAQGEIIFSTRSTPIRDVGVLENKIRAEVSELNAITHSLTTEAMLSGPEGSSGAVLEGVDSASFRQVTQVEERLVEGQWLEGPNSVVLGRALAKKIGVRVGDAVQALLPQSGGQDQSSTGAPLTATLLVGGIVHFGMHDYDSRYAYLRLEDLQDALDLPNQVTYLRLKLDPGSDIPRVAAELSNRFSYPYRVREWRQLNRNLLYAIETEKAVIAVLLTAILLVAAFNIISALFMLVYEREAEISMLRVLGMKRRDQFMLFSFIGSLIALAGISLGLLCATFVVWIMRKTHLVTLPAEVYRLEYLPIAIRGQEWILIALVALAVSAVATLGPALKAASKVPVEGLKWGQ
jgi:lipoprotein-releasing system permease protein